MAAFSWATGHMMFNTSTGCSAIRDELAQMPASSQPTLSFVHEYVHFIQSLTSYAGANAVCDLLHLGLKAAIEVIHGPLVWDTMDEVAGPIDVATVLSTAGVLPAGTLHEWRKHFDSRRRDIGIFILAQAIPCPLAVDPLNIIEFPVELDGQLLDCKGFVSPPPPDKSDWPSGMNAFRPISPGMLAENMARQVDRWVNSTMKYAHTWPTGYYETHVYTNLRELLSRLTPAAPWGDQEYRERMLVVMCQLSLASRRPDQSFAAMYDRATSATLPSDVDEATQVLLTAIDEDTPQGLDWAYYDEVASFADSTIGRMYAEPARTTIQQHLLKLYQAVQDIQSDPLRFASPAVDWSVVSEWVSRYGVPRLEAVDGEVTAVAGTVCDDAVFQMLRPIWHALSTSATTAP